MTKVIAIVGSQYGDEGKGLMTDYYSSQYDDAVVIRSNGGAQAGHCQTGDTLITTVGGLQYIGEVVGKKTNTLISHALINMNSDIENTSLLFTEQNKSINKITLKNGIELKGTNPHAYYVWNGEQMQCEWVKIIDLDINKHQFIIPKNQPHYMGLVPKLFPVVNETDYVHNKVKLNVHKIDIDFLAFFMGLMNGDGNFNKKKKGAMKIYFNIQQMDTVEYVKAKLIHMGINVRIKEHVASNQCFVLSINNSDLAAILENQLGVKIETGSNKITPKFVLQGTKKIIIEYIRGLMDADGTTKFHKIQNSNKNFMSGRIGFTNISFKMIKELQQLLYIIGINSLFNEDKQKSSNHQRIWTLSIDSLHDLLSYNKFIGFPSEYKQKRCNRLIKFKQESLINMNATGYIIKLPHEDKKNIYNQCNKKCRKGNTIRAGFVTSNNFAGYENLKTICNDYHIINIKQIELNYSIEQVYDVTMPETHSYIANGCISHNTVVTPEGDRHVFSHFGSGTFNGSPTFLSKHFVCNPMVFAKEHKAFVEEFGIVPKIYIDAECLVTTPFDMLLNQTHEAMRGDDVHGSCGVGFGETLERALVHDSLHVVDISYFLDNNYNMDDFNVCLYNILDEYVPSRIDLSKVSTEFLKVLNSDKLIEDFIEACRYMLEHTEYAHINTFRKNTLIFEAAQGLLLDMDYGYFPHVTRSNCGMKNITNILEDIPDEHDITVNYVRRAYTTRHGAGPLDGEVSLGELGHNVVDETNITNEFQGSLRFAYADFSLFNSITDKDFLNYAPRGSKKVTTMTCIDQLGDIVEISPRNDGRGSFRRQEFIQIAEQVSDYLSYGPTRDDVKKLDK